ncbi:hypothetical protein [Blastococcus sp. CCUG 61487]|uniref:hypothetical protein n=1 Tax=Blastococcus sp. CCUG 61487 TaxID=1840703 RepID=UPI0010C14356|nr:hypothetical protein [Blastococcus sp. CCUG 61487]TKJ28120.1 hypothetical protein A6V29_03165 [Blastococcus sp. CCUG 61487]
MDRHRTATALPFAHLSMATAALREALARQLREAGDTLIADWSTLRVVGPFEQFDRSGRRTYEYRGSVQHRRRVPALPNARPATQPATV